MDTWKVSVGAGKVTFLALGVITWVICFMVVYYAVNLHCMKFSVCVLYITTKRLIYNSEDDSDKMYVVSLRAFT